MAFSLTWLPDALKIAGLKVSLVPGWENRGSGDVGRVFGVICHHTGTKSTQNMPTLNLLVRGRSDLPGPLAQLGLARDGTYFVIAAGRANHAGKGVWQGVKNGNSNFIGIEAENSGLPSDPWPQIQLDAYHHGVAAILRHIGQAADFCCGHKEYALPSGRKPDPGSIKMDDFRAAVRAIMGGTVPLPALIPAVEPKPQAAGQAPRPTLRRGMNGELTKQVQRKLKLDPDGNFGPKTEAAIREFQRRNGFTPDGIVGPKTWLALDAVA